MIKKTALFDQHKAHQAKFTSFAGWKMPLEFIGAKKEHIHVRNHVGIFDVSHMGEIRVQGAKSLDLLTQFFTNDADRLRDGQSQYTLMCNSKGGILDDLIVYCLKYPVDYLLCVNAANQKKDFQWMVHHCSFSRSEVQVADVSDQMSLLAIQGPKSFELMEKVFQQNFHEVKKFTFKKIQFQKKELLVSNTGYTGERGFEIFTPTELIESLWLEFFKYQEEFSLLPIGLLARNTLRLEMKYPLYGEDMNESINPLEMGFMWACKNQKDFIGKQFLSQTPNQKWVGFMMHQRGGIPRKGYLILSDQQEQIGQVTGGILSPCLDRVIGLGLVAKEHSTIGTSIQISIHSSHQSATVVSTPFWKGYKG